MPGSTLEFNALICEHAAAAPPAAAAAAAHARVPFDEIDRPVSLRRRGAGAKTRGRPAAEGAARGMENRFRSLVAIDELTCSLLTLG